MTLFSLNRWAAVAALLGAAACGHDRGAPPPKMEAAPRRVQVVPVSRSEAGGEVSVPGAVAARQHAALAARVPAAVMELPFREGERVAVGAVLVRLDDRALTSAVAAAQADLRAAEADHGRMQALLEKNAATPREADATAVRAAAARATLAGAKDNLSYAVLRAPFAGTVTVRRVHVGDVVSPGAPLLDMEGDAGLEVRAAVDASTAARLQRGQRVLARVDGHPEPLEAVIRSLSPAGDMSTHRFELRADLPAVSGVRSGVFARLLLQGAGAEARLLVPEAAIFERGGLAGVFVVDDGRARLRWVAVGPTAGGWTELRAGLAAGEKVVVDPALLSDGARVEEAS